MIQSYITNYVLFLISFSFEKNLSFLEAFYTLYLIAYRV